MNDDLSAVERPTRVYWVLLACILALTLATRLARLDTPPEMYFDEIYFGFTAQQYLAGDANAYNPFATSPPNRNYEWTHPPLGKLIIAGAMAVTSAGPWGMRLSSVLFGAAAVALVAAIAMGLTRSPRAALLAAALYAVEGLNFVQSRIATMDIHLMAFMLAAIAFYVAWRRRPDASNWLLLGAGAMAGAALATKWVAVLPIALMGADLLVLWLFIRQRNNLRTILTAGACLVLLPAAMYLASYIHYFLMGYHGSDFVELQRQMWYYHSHLKAEHPYSSKPWQWMLNLRPVWLYVNYAPEGSIANIYTLGNSVVLYFGLAALALVLVRFVWRFKCQTHGIASTDLVQITVTFARRFTWEMAFLLAAYLVFLLPWMLSPRIVFFYHYLPSTAFLCVAGGWVLSGWQLGPSRVLRALAWAVPILAVAWFAVFYPDMTAIPVPRWWADAVYGFIPSWK